MKNFFLFSGSLDMARKNNVDIQQIADFAEKIKKNPQTAEQKLVVEGEWSLKDESFSYSALITYGPENKTTTFKMDHAIFAGGGGNLPAPLQFGYFWIASCTAGTFAIVSALMGIELKKLKTKAEVGLDWTQVFGVAPKPIITGVKLTFEIESNASEEKLKQVEKAVLENCPAVYTLKNPIPVESKLVILKK